MNIRTYYLYSGVFVALLFSFLLLAGSMSARINDHLRMPPS